MNTEDDKRRELGLLEGSRKLIITIVMSVLVMLSGYTMTVNADAVIMGLVGLGTAFMTGNLIERNINYRRDRNNEYGD